MKYSIVIPVHNEEKHLAHCLESVLEQSLQAAEVIVVDDNSTDDSAQIATEFQRKFPQLRLISSETLSNHHEPGAKIVNAFYKGFEQISKDWDFIVKLDADVILTANYFKKIAECFQSGQNIGIAGGVAFIEKNDEWVAENIGDKRQVRGPFKSYTKECFEKIGGIRRTIGWDTLDEIMAASQGFKVEVIPDLIVKLQKPTGTDYKKIHTQKMGQAFYKMDYGWCISTVAAAKEAWKRRRILVFFSIMNSFAVSSLRSEPKAVTKEEGRFVRRFRWRGILAKLGLKNKF
ncbi:MAG: glycosyltransferase family A protein [Weeksellaceae bacterium]|nr:glycosyltransferase family A protein [Weeksellaceae bacterium]